MKTVFHPGDTKTFSRKVRPEDCAVFDTGAVHPLYATFALARDAEWCCRLFVLDMKDDDEEGIGTSLCVEHHAPAPVHAEVKFTATIESIRGNEIICSYKACVGKKIIATGRQGQRILTKAGLQKLYDTQGLP